MFDRFNIEKDNDFSAYLYKNKREMIGIIDRNFITNIKYSFTNIWEMTLEIPNFIYHNGKKIDVPLYNSLITDTQIVVNDKTRFVVKPIERDEKKDGLCIKKATAYSFEYKLREKNINLTGNTRQMYVNGVDEHIADGILNWFAEETGWKIGYVDKDARGEKQNVNEIITSDVTNNYSNNQAQNGVVLYDKDVSIAVKQGDLNFDISYLNIKLFDETTTNGIPLITNPSIAHRFEGYKQGIKHIKARYTNIPEWKFCIEYTFTLNDNSTKVEYKPFCAIEGRKVNIDKIVISYATGILIEKHLIKYRWFDEQSISWYDFLRDTFQKAYDCVCVFDTLNTTINVYARDNIGEVKPIMFSYDNWIKKINKVEKGNENCTRMYVKSNKEKVNIIDQNPLGGEYLEDFTPMKQLMPQSLLDSLDRYYKLCENKQIEWLQLKQDKGELDNKIIKLSDDIKALEERIRGLRCIQVAYMKDYDTQDVAKIKLQNTTSEIAQLQNEYNQKNNALKTLQSQSDDKSNKMKNIGLQIDRKNATDDKGKDI